MRIYVLIEADYEGCIILLVDTNKENIMKKFYDECSVQIWESGEYIKTIEYQERFNEEVWL